MKNVIKIFINILFNESYNLYVKLFNLLALAGFITSLTIYFVSISTDASMVDQISVFSSAVLSLVLLIYSIKTQKYKLFYLVTKIVIFMILFPIMFFTAGGYHWNYLCST